MEYFEPRAAPTPTVRTSSSTVPTSEMSIIEDEEIYDHSTIPLRQKIEKIRNEKFNPKTKIYESDILKKQVRNVGIQKLNFNVESSGKNSNISMKNRNFRQK